MTSVNQRSLIKQKCEVSSKIDIQKTKDWSHKDALLSCKIFKIRIANPKNTKVQRTGSGPKQVSSSFVWKSFTKRSPSPFSNRWVSNFLFPLYRYMLAQKSHFLSVVAQGVTIQYTNKTNESTMIQMSPSSVIFPVRVLCKILLRTLPTLPNYVNVGILI